MPRCGATFDENTVPPWTRGDFRGVDAATDPPRRCAPPLRRKGFSEEATRAASKLYSGTTATASISTFKPLPNPTCTNVEAGGPA
jgi:hypothetical protein